MLGANEIDWKLKFEIYWNLEDTKLIGKVLIWLNTFESNICHKVEYLQKVVFFI